MRGDLVQGSRLDRKFLIIGNAGGHIGCAALVLDVNPPLQYVVVFVNKHARAHIFNPALKMGLSRCWGLD